MISQQQLKANFETFNLSQKVAVWDIETPSQASHSAILSIGVVIVDLLAMEKTDCFFQPVQLAGQQYLKRITHDTATMTWWNHPDRAAARELAFDTHYPNRVPLAGALVRLNEFMARNFHHPNQVQVFGNGPEFDNVILANAYDACKIEQYGYYGGNQSLRTMVWLGRALLGSDPKYQLPFKGIQHHALDDASHEADYLLSLWQGLIEQQHT